MLAIRIVVCLLGLVANWNRSASTRSERTIGNLPMGRMPFPLNRVASLGGINNIDIRLLTAPFEYAPAFDVALKRVVSTLGRSSAETGDDVVRNHPSHLL